MNQESICQRFMYTYNTACDIQVGPWMFASEVPVLQHPTVEAI